VSNFLFNLLWEKDKWECLFFLVVVYEKKFHAIIINFFFFLIIFVHNYIFFVNLTLCNVQNHIEKRPDHFNNLLNDSCKFYSLQNKALFLETLTECKWKKCWLQYKSWLLGFFYSLDVEWLIDWYDLFKLYRIQ